MTCRFLLAVCKPESPTNIARRGLLDRGELPAPARGVIEIAVGNRLDIRTRDGLGSGIPRLAFLSSLHPVVSRIKAAGKASARIARPRPTCSEAVSNRGISPTEVLAVGGEVH